MKQATARFRRPANGGVRLGRARSAARLLMFVLLLAALVLLTLAVFYYTRNTAQAMEAELCQKMLVSAGQTRNNIDYRFEQVKESASALIGTLYPYLNSDADTAVQLEEYAKIRRALSEQLDKHMITRLRLYVPDEKIYSGQKTTLYSLDPLSSLGENGSVYQKGGVFWHGTHLVSLGISEPTAVVSCAVALKSQADYDKLCGVLFADVSVSQFHEIFAAGSTNHDEMFLADAQGRILAHTDDAHLGETALPPSLMEQVCSLGSGYLLEPDVILAFSRLETTEWYVISSMPRAQVYTMDSGAVNTIVSMWVVACLILFIIAVTAAYSLNLNRTVSRLNAAIHTLDAENGTGNTDSCAGRRKGGLITLERDTEQIVRSIAAVVDARYRDRLAISEYQMESLQAQIKPHFLYNTLDVIKWMILDKNPDDSVWMVNALSRYLRMSINKGEAIVPLSDELDLTRTYLGIMQKRFSHQFEVEYDLDQAAMECLIPKLSLQPLVENALLHGILYCDKTEKRLVIRAWRSSRAFGVEIEDNGNGMAPETAQKLTELDIRTSKSYGVANVRKRLDIFGQGKCKFYISARKGIGTCVMIELPVQPHDSD